MFLIQYTIELHRRRSWSVCESHLLSARIICNHPSNNTTNTQPGHQSVTGQLACFWVTWFLGRKPLIRFGSTICTEPRLAVQVNGTCRRWMPRARRNENRRTRKSELPNHHELRHLSPSFPALPRHNLGHAPQATGPITAIVDQRHHPIWGTSHRASTPVDRSDISGGGLSVETFCPHW